MNQTDTLEKRLIAIGVEKRLPVMGSLELLPLCNMNCKMCYVRLSKAEMDRIDRLRTLEEWKLIADQLQEAGVIFLMITGGEPLLYPNFKELYTYLRELGMIMTINTNATLMDDAWISFFKEYPPRRFNITLYGADADTYKDLCGYQEGFEKCITAIQKLKAAGMDVKINGTLVERNKDQYQELIRIANELDCPINIDTHIQPACRERSRAFDRSSRMEPKVAAKRCVEIMRLKQGDEEFHENVQAILKDLQKHREEDKSTCPPQGINCLAAKTSFVINWRGQMQPCVMLPEPSFDVLAEGFMPCWNQLVTECEKIRRNEKCFRCDYRSECVTCPACGLHEAGAVDALPEYACAFTEEFYRLLEEISRNQ